MKRLSFLLVALVVSLVLVDPASAQTGTIAANGQCRSIDTDNKGQGTLEISGTWTGTLTWYVSNGVARAAIDLATPSDPGTAVNSTTANGHWFGNVAGWRTFEVCATASWTGTATIWLNASNSGGGGGGVSSGGVGGGGLTDAELRATPVPVSATNLDIQSGGADLATAAQLTTQAGYLDGVETLLGTNITNTAATVTALGLVATEATQLLNLAQNTLTAGFLDDLLNSLAVDTVHDSPVTDSGPPLVAEASLLDGTAQPNPVSAEGDGVRLKASLEGIQYMAVTNAAGTKTPFLPEDQQHVTADLGVPMWCVRKDSITSGAADGDYVSCNVDANGRIYMIEASAASIATNTSTSATNTATIATQTGPWTVDRYITVGTGDNEHQVKATAGTFGGMIARNTSTANAFVKCTNLTAANTTPGSSAVFWDMLVPANSTASGGFTHSTPTGGATFSTGFTCYVVTGETDADATDVAADKVTYTAYYR